MKKHIFSLCSLLISSTMFCMDSNNINVHQAVQDGKIDRLREILLKNNMLANARNEHQQTPLHLADDIKIAQLLVQYGADVKAVDEDQQTPLHLAAFEGDEDLVQFFLDRGALINARDNRGRTPLHYTSREDSDENEAETETTAVAELLLNSFGVQINAQDDQGETPLHKASALGNTELTLLLLQHGADMNITNDDVQTPFILALENDHHQVTELLNDWPYYKSHQKRLLTTFMMINNEPTSTISDLNGHECENIIKLVRIQWLEHSVQQIHDIAEQERASERLVEQQRGESACKKQKKIN